MSVLGVGTKVTPLPQDLAACAALTQLPEFAMSTNSTEFLKASDRLGLDYTAEADEFTELPYPIIDAHSHLS